VATDAVTFDAAAVRRYQRTAVIAGAVGLVLCALGWLVTPDHFFRSYLWAYCFFLGIALGSLVLNMLQFQTGGVWGLVIRRILEASTRTLPVLALLFLPIVAGFLIPARGAGEGSAGQGDPQAGTRPAISGIYIWADPAVLETDHALEFKARYYLNVPFFLARAAVCFAVWLLFMYLVDRSSVALDRPDVGDTEPRHLRKISGAGLVLYGITVTVMAIDWIMSLEPHWVSSIFGPLVGIGQVLNALSFTVIVLVLASDRPPLSEVVGRPILRDLGGLMLTFVMVWAYLSFSQLLLIWSGNLPSEIPYYLRRTQGGWQVFAVALALFHFALPFLLLLSFDVKRNRKTLLQVAAILLAMRAVDLYWLIMPAHPGEAGLGFAPFVPGWTDLVAPVAIGGIWLAAFLGQLQRRPLMPTYDPRLAEAVHHE
jgi:hypothetical protein